MVITAFPHYLLSQHKPESKSRDMEIFVCNLPFDLVSKKSAMESQAPSRNVFERESNSTGGVSSLREVKIDVPDT